jgi:glucan phosphoethanolaminetransferase (alkaline phosphatase superfamily)
MLKPIRKYQTLILALISFLSFIYALLVVFDVPVNEVVSLLGMTFLGFLFIFVSAGAFFLIFLALKKWVFNNNSCD